MSIFLKGLFWGSLIFLSWPITLALGLALGLFFRYWGIILGFLLIDILFLQNNGSLLMPALPLTVLAVTVVFIGTFLQKYVWMGKDSF